jgi:Tfp pilus assembly protein PilF
VVEGGSMAVMNIWIQMARSQFQADDLDAALGSVNQALKVESTADAWALKEQILTERATRGKRVL